MAEHILYEGPARVIEAAVLQDGSMPAKEFIQSLIEADQAKVYALFRRLGDMGRISNPEKFKKIEGSNFWGFKSFQIRMPCFFLPYGRVVVTHGFKKKQDKMPKEELWRAYRIKEEHMSREGGSR